MNYKSHILTGGISIIFLFTHFSINQEEFDLKASIERGKNIYIINCLSCHMENGEGIEGLYPPVAKSDYMLADTKRSIREILYGVSGEMTVNGKIYNLPMKGYELNDEQASDVLNYMRNSWGNKAEAVKPEDVKMARKTEADSSMAVFRKLIPGPVGKKLNRR
jgi:mono/diheme cytochrome c family protein